MGGNVKEQLPRQLVRVYAIYIYVVVKTALDSGWSPAPCTLHDNNAIKARITRSRVKTLRCVGEKH